LEESQYILRPGSTDISKGKIKPYSEFDLKIQRQKYLAVRKQVTITGFEMPTPQSDPEDDPGMSSSCLGPGPFSCAPVEVGHIGSEFTGKDVFMTWPLLGPLLFENEGSDARDHCANERSGLSYSLF
jgi:hypothetical protein